MTEETRQSLLAAGVQVDEALDRFLSNEALLTRFLKKFPEDTNYGELLGGLEAGDVERAFRAAHTLKGVGGNLSLVRLVPLVSSQTEFLRAGDLAGAAALMPQVTREYEDLCSALARCLG